MKLTILLFAFALLLTIVYSMPLSVGSLSKRQNDPCEDLANQLEDATQIDDQEEIERIKNEITGAGCEVE
jgi:hypothetical protein